ncbi:1234_t:CDS:2, partial [Acaulospora colombiana]
MDRFTRADLTSSLQPVLAANETILATQDNVGLYDGNEKAADHSNGIVYLTSHRVFYVDLRQPTIHSIAVDLRLIKGRDFYNQYRLKIEFILILRIHRLLLYYHGFVQYVHITIIKVPNVKESADSYTKSSDDNDIRIECPKCTFLNHPSMSICEICDNKLGIYDIENDAEAIKNVVDRSGDRPDFIKLAFRGGGHNAFYEKLKLAMSMKEWEKTVEPQISESSSEVGPSLGGITIFNKAEQNKKEQEQTLTQAFKDLDGLMTKAAEVVKLVESISLRINKESTDSESSVDETNTFRTYLIELGISNPVTNDEQTAQHILELIKTTGPLTAIDLASLDKMSIALATEQLLMVEARGLICRDETVEGIRFYENLIINFQW